MRTETKDGTVVPALIFTGDKRLIGAGLINDKGYRKSIEQHAAWLINGASGKLLPDSRIRGFRNIARKDEHVEIIADGFETPNSADSRTAKNDPPHSPDSVLKNTPSGELPATLENAGKLLGDLETIIRERRETRPKGSYTTHLFNTGEDHIRKKTGEEAVELILSRTNAELASETADLLYHVMVLFSARDMSLAEALRILWERR